jgi:hypothetical protein
LAATILLFTSSSWASGLVLQRKYSGTTHIASKECKTQNVEDVIFLAAQNTIDSIHIVSSKLDSVQAILQPLHGIVSSVNELFSRIGLCISLKIFSGQWVCWIGGLNSFLDNLSELMVKM